MGEEVHSFSVDGEAGGAIIDLEWVPIEHQNENKIIRKPISGSTRKQGASEDTVLVHNALSGQALDGSGTTTSTVDTWTDDSLLPKHNNLFQRFRSGKIQANAAPPSLPPRNAPLPPLVEPASPANTKEQSPQPIQKPNLSAIEENPFETPQLAEDEVSKRIHPDEPAQDTTAIRPDASALRSDTQTQRTPLTRAQSAYQKRLFSTPRRPGARIAFNKHRATPPLVAVDSAMMRDAFPDFSYANSAANQTSEDSQQVRGTAPIDIGAESGDDNEMGDVTRLKEQVEVLSRQLSELGNLVRETRSARVTAQNTVTPVQGRAHCCAAELLCHVLGNTHRPCRCTLQQTLGYYTDPCVLNSSATANCAPTQLYMPAAPTLSRHRSPLQRPSPQHKDRIQERVEDINEHWYDGRRREYHNNAQPGWVRVGKFQVRRMSR